MSSMAQMGAIVVTNSCEIGTGASAGIIKGSSSSVACSSSSSFHLLTNFSPNRICLKRTTSSCSRVSTSCEDIVKKRGSKALVYVVAAAASSSGPETAGEQEEEGGDAAAGKLEKKKQGTTTTEWVKLGLSSFVAVGAALVLTTQAAPALAEAAAEDNSAFQTYFGTAASASSYGGYGGNTSKKDSAEYIFDVPQVLSYIPNLPKKISQEFPSFWKPKNSARMLRLYFSICLCLSPILKATFLLEIRVYLVSCA